MNIRSLIKMFLPPVYYKIKVAMAGSQKTSYEPMNQIKKSKEKIVVIGNGPSFAQTMERYGELLKNYDTCVVNSFVLTEFYEFIKPTVYALADPGYFTYLEKAEDHETSYATIHGIVERTHWPMAVVIPDNAKGLYADNCFKKNKNITIYYYNTKDCRKQAISKYEAWDNNTTCPPCQTVMNLAVWLGLYWGYKETYLVGTDTSFLEDIRIDQKTNELMTIDRHFYNTEDVCKDKGLFNAEHMRPYPGWKLHDLIFAFGKMFENYYLLREYADHKGLKVYNASEYSWINCFERKKLK